ncbi:hypothetical protein A8924_0205 [Saccharopolyspora erythraea NRRL 2338]|uniref:Uncharacterized protein n=2 Tax=Saccharopolyspora erythraea TaxID=1836 RepID=A4FQQ4_SACEN|nr:hypothetical protein [Saccharopolyspora erythraea]EQD87726.1 hypothetical protein N599_02935 [Saccharopolyspora erythraea D]PFG92981.1 hypothetical protein A8924_0205 [Saccharopolyspora erythraea NRRL 2338]QRK89872.1 hypothetical protein JQX30_36160 [Saccharopolyspora erythraea]CAM06379.1 hypothetical protein SACE_7221 [Saccharopolyspora erythraea NRRL 2338]
MKASSFLKLAAAAGIAVGLSAFAAPSALADVNISGGDQAVVEQDGLVNKSDLTANNKFDLHQHIVDSLLIERHH